MSDLKGRALITSLKLVPKNLLSRMAGRVASLSLPLPLRRLQLRSFGKTFGVDFDEVRAPLDSFASVQDFFVRELKEGARPVDDAADSFVSPCDGAWGSSGIVSQGSLLQVKGRPYSLGALLGDDEHAAAFEGGPFATLYLSPKDYHRFHSPVAGEVLRADYLPGTLWPVNRAGVSFVEGLFAQNERIVAWVAPRGHPEARLCMVAVGATCVGKVKINFDDLETNVPRLGRTERYYPKGARPALDKGQEWGRFEFGSTIVLVATPGWIDLAFEPEGSGVRLGSRIGTLLETR
jgi:phosphatidylserine decarboxylase